MGGCDHHMIVSPERHAGREAGDLQQHPEPSRACGAF